MNLFTRSISFLVLWLFLSGVAFAHDLSGEWTLKVEDQHHKLISTLTIKFTKQKASSCISGDWKQITVVSSTTKNPEFYPVSDSLSYDVDKGQLAIGRNDICDDYLMLRGSLKNNPIQGEYYGLGLGWQSPLGFFKLMRKK